jgi:hypothetical protein
VNDATHILGAMQPGDPKAAEEPLPMTAENRLFP